MTGDSRFNLGLIVDTNNQWFVNLWVTLRGKSRRVCFKVDTGCNGLVLSHKTLETMGYSTAKTALAKLNDEIGILASGEKTTFKKLGLVSLNGSGSQHGQICSANAICHATRETNDLLGTEVLRQFSTVAFNLDGRFLELLKKR